MLTCCWRPRRLRPLPSTLLSPLLACLFIRLITSTFSTPAAAREGGAGAALGAGAGVPGEQADEEDQEDGKRNHRQAADPGAGTLTLTHTHAQEGGVPLHAVPSLNVCPLLQLRREKIDLENTLEQEQEALVNRLWKRMDKLEAEKRCVSIHHPHPSVTPTHLFGSSVGTFRRPPPAQLNNLSERHE